MSITIETDIETILPFPEEVESEEPDPLPGTQPLAPSETLITKMDSYDEDLNANPFFQSFMVSCPDLFSQCVEQQWLICVPRRDSLPKYAFTLEDFTHHILRPLPKSHSRYDRQFSGDSDGVISNCVSPTGDIDGSFLSSRSGSSCGGNDAASSISSIDENSFSFTLSSPAISQTNANFLSAIAAATGSSTNVSGATNYLKGHWNYRTLSHVNVEYSGTTLILDVEVPISNTASGSGSKAMQNAVEQLSSPGDESGISFQTGDNDSFISFKTEGEKSPAKSSIFNEEDENRVQLRKEVLFEETFYTNSKQRYKVLCVSSPVNSKIDIEDENFGSSGLGLWNLSSVRDSIDFLWSKGPKILSTYDVNIKIFQNNHQGLENFPLKVQKQLVQMLYEKCFNFAITYGGFVSLDTPQENQALNDFVIQKLRLATETYILDSLYRQVISAITSYYSLDDAVLNKVMRNLTFDLHPQDLDIASVHWDNLTRAKHELGRLNSYSSPLGKLTCMKKTLRYLRPTPFSAQALIADELIPIWCYLILKNPLGNWMAQLQFLRNFRFSVESGQQMRDNENSFYITTLEASLEHLRSGKVLGISDNERDVGMPCDLGEAWLYSVHSKAMESTDSPLGEMFDVIRLGNCPRLDELIQNYESEREDDRNGEKIDEPLSSPTKKKSINFEGLCHPLCQCEKCVKIIIQSVKEMEEIEKELSIPAVNLQASEGLTMLHVACIYGRPNIVEYLIEAGADLEAQDVDGMTALHFASSRGHQNALLLLLDAGAFLEPRNSALNTPLHLAAQNGHEGCVKALIYDAEQRGRKLHLSARNRKGDTPLHFASRWGFQGIAQILVEHGAAIRIHNIRHVTPLDCAHDIHILKTLQRSLRRRSLVGINHGDFINIEMVQKEGESGIVMLISEPKEPPKVHVDEKLDKLEMSASFSNKNRSGNNSRNTSRNASRVPSRRASTVTMPDLIPGTMAGTPLSLPRSRKTSSILNPMKGINEETTRSLLKDVAEHLQHQDDDSCNTHCDNIYLSVGNNNYGGTGDDSDHIRRISVQSLEDCRIASAESAFTGLLSLEDTKDRDIKKIFSAIHHSDFPLALFYLGIPAEELSNPENDLPSVQQIFSCHPLCQCIRCVSKNAGLGLSLDVKNPEGYTPLHVAVERNLHSLVKILIRFGADINCQSSHDKKTALDIAVEKGLAEIEDTLVACGGKSTTSFALEPSGHQFWGGE